MMTVPPRAAPACCASCESRTLKRHCRDVHCAWLVCQKCAAVNGIIGNFKDGKFLGWRRACFTRPAPTV